MDEQELIAKALAVRQCAYAPYSNFRVGVALLGQSGKVYVGCNVENASFGLTVCAERNAVAHAIGQGEKAFDRLVVASEAEDPIMPCGACRQVLAEFSSALEVISVNTKGKVLRVTLAELLPRPFLMSKGSR